MYKITVSMKSRNNNFGCLPGRKLGDVRLEKVRENAGESRGLGGEGAEEKERVCVRMYVSGCLCVCLSVCMCL